MSRYYKYNLNGIQPKYIEMTEEEYINVRHDDNRWFISFGNCVLECEKSEYDKHYKELNHYRYTQKNADGKTVETVLIEQSDMEFSYDMSVFNVENETLIDDKVEEALDKALIYEKLRKAMAQLGENERDLITQIFFMNKSQSELASIYGVSQQALSKRCRKILKKLLFIFSNEI